MHAPGCFETNSKIRLAGDMEDLSTEYLVQSRAKQSCW